MSKTTSDIIKNISLGITAVVGGVSALSAAYSAYKESNPQSMEVSYDDKQQTIIAMESRWDISLTGHYRQANYKVYLINEGLKCSFQDKAERIFHVIPHHSKALKCVPMQSSDAGEVRYLLDQAQSRKPITMPGMAVT